MTEVYTTQFTSPKGLGRVAIQALLLGFLGGVCCSVILFFSTNSQVMRLSLYGLALTIFHAAEFFITAIYNPQALVADSFLLNHSNMYAMAHILALTEWGLSTVLFPQGSSFSSLTFYVGLILTILSQLVRSGAMATAGASFHHLIQTQQADHHRLVRHGLYRYMRHPSYSGFFFWTIGTQLLLGNAIMTIVLTIVAWQFFARRIPYEEESLQKQYPDEYAAYHDETTFSGVPFVHTQKLFKTSKVS